MSQDQEKDPGSKKEGNAPKARMPLKPANKKPQLSSNRFGILLFVGLLLGLGVILYMGENGAVKSIPYSQFLKLNETNSIVSVTIIDNQRIQGTYQAQGEEHEFKTAIPYIDANLIDKLHDKNVAIEGGSSRFSPLQILLSLAPWILIIIFFWYIFRQTQGGGGGRNAFTFGNNKARKYTDAGSKVTFKDVAGQKEAKKELEEVVDFLKYPKKFVQIGAKIPKGVLLVGPPGTGKTLLAKAVAGEANVTYLHISGSDFVEMFVGVGAARVRSLFEQAKKTSPCIIFIDELDAVGRTRGAGLGGGHDEREQTLNQMLVEMDGFSTHDGVIVIAATNRPDVLDPALLRPGRFDRQVVIDMPDIAERRAILKIHCKKVSLSDEIDFDLLGKATPGFSGAQLANLVNEAALHAARHDRKKIEMQDFEEARDKTLMGVPRRSRHQSDQDRLATAYHEAGHAILYYLLPNMGPLHKVTIVPRGMALGMAVPLDENRFSYKKNELLNQIKVLYGGYVAEQLFYQETTTGVRNDLERATNLARKMVVELGMSNLGPLFFGNGDQPIFLGREISQHRDYSESMAQKIDEEIQKIILACLKEVQELFKKNREQIDKLARVLLEKETLADEDIRSILGIESLEMQDKVKEKSTKTHILKKKNTAKQPTQPNADDLTGVASDSDSQIDSEQKDV